MAGTAQRERQLGLCLSRVQVSYAYDSRVWRGPYLRLSVPTVPISIGGLPSTMQAVASYATFELDYAQASKIEVEPSSARSVTESGTPRVAASCGANLRDDLWEHMHLDGAVLDGLAQLARVQIVDALEQYDGPLDGPARYQGRDYWFSAVPEWIIRAGEPSQPRLYVLHKITREQADQVRAESRRFT